MVEQVIPPNRKHIKWIYDNRSDAESVQAFDEKFGEGQAASILAKMDAELAEQARIRKEAEEEDRRGFISDVGYGMARGFVQASDEAADFLIDMVDYIPGVPSSIQNFGPDATGGLEETFGFQEEAQTGVGRFTDDITQFTTGFVGLGKLRAALGMKKIHGGQRALEASLRGGLADAVVFDATDDTIVDMLANNSELADIATAYLQTDQEDPELLNRLRRFAVGAGLGLAVDSTVDLIANFLKRKKIGDTSASNSEAEAAFDAAKREGAGATTVMDDAASVPTVDIPDPRPVYEVAPAVPEGELLGEATEETVKQGFKPLNAQQVGDITANAERLKSLRESMKETGKDFYQNDEITARLMSDGVTINVPKLGSTDEVRDYVFAMQASLSDSFKAARGPATKTWKETTEAAEKLAEDVGADPASFKKFIDEARELGKDVDEVIQTARLLVDGKTRAADQILEAVKNGDYRAFGGSEKMAHLQLARAYSEAVEAAAAVQALGTGAGRGLNLLKSTAAARDDLVNKLREVNEGVDLSDADLEAYKGFANDMKALEGVPLSSAERRAVAAQSLFHNLGVEIERYFINSILSGLDTQFVNIEGNAAVALIMPLERGVAGLFRGVGAAARGNLKEGGKRAAAEAEASAAEYASYLVNSFTSMKYALIAMKRGENIARATPGTLDPLKAAAKGGEKDVTKIGEESIKGMREGLKKGDYASVTVNGLKFMLKDVPHASIGVPSRGLMGMDEFFQQQVARASIRRDAVVEARMAGKNTKDTYADARQAIEDGFVQKDKFRIRKGVAVKTEQKGMLTNENAKRRAGEATHTTPLEVGTLSKYVQMAASQNFALKMLMPFVRTPTRILGWTWERTPLISALVRKMRGKAFKGSAEDTADLMARWAVGSALYTLGWQMATDGMTVGDTHYSFVGRYGGNLSQQQAMRKAGIQSYALVATNTKTGEITAESMVRLDPFSLFMGLMSDIAHIRDQGDANASMDAKQLSVAAAVAMIQNISSKSYFQGMIGGAMAVSDPQRYGPTFFGSTAGGFVPSILAKSVEDPYMREMYTVMDRLKGRTPERTELGTKRDLFYAPLAAPAGRQWDPSKETTVDTSPETLAVLGATLGAESGFGVPPKRTGKVVWTAYKNAEGQSAYDRYMDLISKPDYGPSLRESIANVVNQGWFDDLPASEQRDEISSIYSDYKSDAKEQVLQEYPELAQALEDQETNKESRDSLLPPFLRKYQEAVEFGLQ